MYTKEATSFDCGHNFRNSKTEKRCVVCRMPIGDENISLELYNTRAIFCCRDCEEHYEKKINEMDL